MQADHYEWTQERLARAGYEHYEISNWARPGRRCRHNLVYWQNREYLGLGAGAHSFLNGVRFSTVLLPNRYVELVDESVAARDDGGGTMRHVVGAETITPELSMADTLILGLRLIDGIDLPRSPPLRSRCEPRLRTDPRRVRRLRPPRTHADAPAADAARPPAQQRAVPAPAARADSLTYPSANAARSRSRSSPPRTSANAIACSIHAVALRCRPSSDSSGTVQVSDLRQHGAVDRDWPTGDAGRHRADDASAIGRHLDQRTKQVPPAAAVLRAR